MEFNIGNFRGIAAIIAFYFVAWLVSEDRGRFSWKILISGVLMQFAFALLLLEVPSVTNFLTFLSQGLHAISNSTSKALEFCFGALANPKREWGFILVLHGFPVLIVISALSSLLMYWKILPLIIKMFSLFFRKTLGVGGTLGLSVGANMFTGMSETPLVIKPYLSRLTRSELFSLMTCGMTGIAASVMVLYSIILRPIMEDGLQHVLASMLIGIPVALTFSRIMIPETKSHLTEEQDFGANKAKNSLDAIFIGTMDGGRVFITIVAMFIGFISLVDVFNTILSFIEVSGEPLSMQRILGIIFAPITWMMGVDWSEASVAGSLLGLKIITNELIAYQEFASVGANISYHSKMIITYALCGFASFGSVGIILGVYNALVPSRRDEISVLAFKALLSGTLGNCTTAAIIGLLYQ